MESNDRVFDCFFLRAVGHKAKTRLDKHKFFSELVKKIELVFCRFYANTN